MKLVMRQIKWTLRRQLKPLQLLLAASEYLIHVDCMSDNPIATPITADVWCRYKGCQKHKGLGAHIVL